jgi:hypothetical protein
MVCGKCQKLGKTTLATPDVKKKNEMYYGSPAGSSSGDKKSATLGQTGISKVKHPLRYTRRMGKLTCVGWGTEQVTLQECQEPLRSVL